MTHFSLFFFRISGNHKWLIKTTRSVKHPLFIPSFLSSLVTDFKRRLLISHSIHLADVTYSSQLTKLLSFFFRWSCNFPSKNLITFLMRSSEKYFGKKEVVFHFRRKIRNIGCYYNISFWCCSFLSSKKAWLTTNLIDLNTNLKIGFNFHLNKIISKKKRNILSKRNIPVI